MAAEHGPFEHVKDSTRWEILPSLNLEFEMPRLVALEKESPFYGMHGSQGYGIYLTKFMVLELVAAVVCVAIFIPFARRARRSLYPPGPLHNFFEAILVFIRDDIARPSIGAHHADRYVPLLWTAFMFILICNLLGMLPFSGSPTSAIGCTGALALATLWVGLASGMREMGVIGFFKSIVPHMDVPGFLKVVLVPMMFLIEVAGLIIRHVVLSVRLFANMFAGHTVLAVILGFIVAREIVTSNLFYLVAPASVLGVVALSLLELFVAFLQAYIFTFLSALFIGMAVHPHH